MNFIKKHLWVGCALFIAALTPSCHDDIKLSSTPDGLPATVKLEFQVPTGVTIESSRAVDDSESEVSELYLVMYSQTNRVEVIPITGLTTTKIGENNGYREYTLEATVSTLSGDYTVYAIANPSSNFCNLLDEIQAYPSKEKLASLLSNSANVIQMSGSNRIPMSGKCTSNGSETISIQPDGDDYSSTNPQSLNIECTLERLMAHIEFTFTSDTEGVTFTPVSYRVYNLPKNARLINSGSSSGNMLSEDENPEYFNMSEAITITEDDFSFLMLENVQDDVTNQLPSSYTNGDETVEVGKVFFREQWSGGDLGTSDGTNFETVDPAKKVFDYAPENSTFVVISGTYEGPYFEAGATTPTNYRGTVTYTVHLGDFGASSTTGGSAGNYTVNRNEIHKYRIHVNGVSSIIAESNVTDLTKKHQFNQGAEGVLIRSENEFVLDAHYETLLITLTETDITTIKNGWTNRTLTLGISSPYNSFNYTVYKQDDDSNDYYDANLKGSNWLKNPAIDYTWLQFMKPIEQGVIPRFPGYQYDSNGNLLTDQTYTDQVLLNQAYPSSTIYTSGSYGEGESVTIGYLCDFCANPEAYCYKYTKNEENYYEVAIFVDEYVYGSHNPKNAALRINRWVNTANRELILNPVKIAISGDQQSVTYDQFIFSIAQRSIKTPYNLTVLMDATDNSFNSAFGLETWDETSEFACETGRPYGGIEAYDALTTSYVRTVTKSDGSTETITISPYNSNNTGPAYHEMYGRLNTLALHQMSGNKAPDDYWKYAGYNGARDNNNLKSHTWELYKRGGVYAQINAMQAMMMRNRDLNGNGQLDENEIKWYLPAIAQMYTVWLGQTALPGDTRLMDLTYFNNNTLYDDTSYSLTYKNYTDSYSNKTLTSDFMNLFPHYFTSTGGDALVYWQDQGTSISSRKDMTGSWCQPYNYARAVRNIPNYNTVPDFPVDGERMRSDNVILVEGLSQEFLRTSSFTGNVYDFHNERDDENYLYKAIQVSENEYTIAPYTKSDGATYSLENCQNDINCTTTSNGSTVLADEDDIKAKWQTIYNNVIKEQLSGNDAQYSDWRFPNQRELMLLYRYKDKNGNAYYNEISTTIYYLCSTYFTHYKVRAYPFTINNGRMNLVGDSNFKAASEYKVRLVRDYTGPITESTSTNTSTNTTYQPGGAAGGVY